MQTQIIPSIIAQTPKETRDRIERLVTHASFFQLDVMDGIFVPHTSLYPILPALPTRCCINQSMKNVTYEAHLMVKNPLAWIKKNEEKISSFIVHYESDAHLHDLITYVRSTKKGIGIALNPETEIESITQYFRLIDRVLIMTVHPGTYGSPFLPEMLEKIKMIRKAAPEIDIEVDGGMNLKNIELCKKAGANQFVVGSFLQKAKNVSLVWKKLEKTIQS